MQRLRVWIMEAQFGTSPACIRGRSTIRAPPISSMGSIRLGPATLLSVSSWRRLSAPLSMERQAEGQVLALTKVAELERPTHIGLIKRPRLARSPAQAGGYA